MANHQQHTTFSSLSGLVFGTLAWYPCGFPASTCLLAGALCSVGGMLPDIDIKTSRSYHDCMSITACITAMLVILRVSPMEGVTAEMTSTIGMAVFVAVKFGIGSLIQSFTKHRGMIHTIPFAILCGQILFLTTAGDIPSRILKGAGLSLGFLSHLLLDELYSVDVVKMNTKKSFGTALKFGMWKNVKLTVVLYFVLFCATFVSFRQPNMISEAVDHAFDQIAELTIRGTQRLEEASRHAQSQLRSGTNFNRTTVDGSQSGEIVPTPPAIANQRETNRPIDREYEMPTLAMAHIGTQTPMTSPTPAFPSVQPSVQPPVTPVNPQGTIPRPSFLSDIPSSGNNTLTNSAASQLPIPRPSF